VDEEEPEGAAEPEGDEEPEGEDPPLERTDAPAAGDPEELSTAFVTAAGTNEVACDPDGAGGGVVATGAGATGLGGAGTGGTETGGGAGTVTAGTGGTGGSGGIGTGSAAAVVARHAAPARAGTTASSLIPG
jgi:hypothetical protein